MRPPLSKQLWKPTSSDADLSFTAGDGEVVSIWADPK